MKLRAWFVSAALLGAAGTADAQTYPSRPITMLVGYAVGGPSDTIARIMAERMKAALGQPVELAHARSPRTSVRAPMDRTHGTPTVLPEETGRGGNFSRFRGPEWR